MPRRPEIRRQRFDERVYAVSHPGGREGNEDDFLVMERNHDCFLAVADGLGGHQAGEIASRCAIQALAASFSQMGGSISEESLRSFFLHAHQEIRNHAKGARAGMGTTLVTVCITGHEAIVAHTGDSRAYLIRDRILYRSRDHSVVQGLVDEGVLSEEEALHHPLKNMLTAALGIDFRVEVDFLTLANGDIILLSSDGFHDFVTENILMHTLRNRPFSQCGETLLQEALQNTTDNVTFVIYQVH
jgi:serine/threonine protein phosphatase PrpC